LKYEIVDAVSQIIRDKGIDRETFQEIIESVFFAMIVRKYGESDNFEVIFNPDKGDIEIQCIKEVVEDGMVENLATEISLSEAKKYDSYAEVGEDTMIIIDYEQEFGRRIVISAKQHLIQRLRDIEKENLYNEFSQRIGEIVIGDIHQINRYEIRINIDKTEVIMPRSEQVYNERYRRGDTVKAIVLEVEKTSREPAIIVSRKSIRFVRRLFELEVPEIYDGIVEIKSIAREAGDRTKIAVDTNDKRVDPVGACVGMKGVRIQAIVKELNREKVDIMHWTPDPTLLIRRSLAPVIPLEIIFDEPNKKVSVVIPDDQIPQVIGRKGQNLRIASQLSGYDIEPIRSSEYYQEELDIIEVEELSDEHKALLIKNGYETAEDVLNAERDALGELDLKPEELDEILQVLNSYYEAEEEDGVL